MTAATAWTAVALVAVVTFAIKGVGPAMFGPRDDGSGLPAPLARVVVLLAAPLLTALVVTNALADGGEIALGGDTVGVLAAAVAVWRGLGVLATVVVAVAVTAVGRQLGLP